MSSYQTTRIISTPFWTTLHRLHGYKSSDTRQKPLSCCVKILHGAKGARQQGGVTMRPACRSHQARVLLTTSNHCSAAECMRSSHMGTTMQSPASITSSLQAVHSAVAWHKHERQFCTKRLPTSPPYFSAQARAEQALPECWLLRQSCHSKRASAHYLHDVHYFPQPYGCIDCHPVTPVKHCSSATTCHQLLPK